MSEIKKVWVLTSNRSGADAQVRSFDTRQEALEFMERIAGNSLSRSVDKVIEGVELVLTPVEKVVEYLLQEKQEP